MEKPKLSEPASTKKAYTPPKLETYGNLRKVTEHTSNTPPHPDPGPHPFAYRT